MNQKLRNLVYTAMLMALCCVATLVIKIPTVTGGYLNAGDIVVVLAALLAGPLSVSYTHLTLPTTERV